MALFDNSLFSLGMFFLCCGLVVYLALLLNSKTDITVVWLPAVTKPPTTTTTMMMEPVTTTTTMMMEPVTTTTTMMEPVTTTTTMMMEPVTTTTTMMQPDTTTTTTMMMEPDTTTTTTTEPMPMEPTIPTFDPTGRGVGKLAPRPLPLKEGKHYVFRNRVTGEYLGAKRKSLTVEKTPELWAYAGRNAHMYSFFNGGRELKEMLGSDFLFVARDRTGYSIMTTEEKPRYIGSRGFRSPMDASASDAIWDLYTFESKNGARGLVPLIQ